MAKTRKSGTTKSAPSAAKSRATAARTAPAARRGAATKVSSVKTAAAPRRTAATATAAAEHPAVAMARGLAKIVKANALSELIVETPEVTLTIRRATAMHEAVLAQPAAVPSVVAAPAVAVPAPAAPAPAPAPVAAAAPPVPEPDDNLHIVTSPFVGTFYRRPNPDAAPYVELGDRVDQGQALCIVEAMKLMNEIESDIAGTIVEVLVDDSQPVEFGQSLFKIAPA